MEQLILHLIGDYITQTHWMADNKTRQWFPALVHALVYSLPFLLLGSVDAVLALGAVHFLIDRYRLAVYVCFLKNRSTDSELLWTDAKRTGYPSRVPDWLSFWLLIVADNTLHLATNWACLKYIY